MPGDIGDKLVVLAQQYMPQEWLSIKNNDDSTGDAFIKRCLKTCEEKIIKEPKDSPNAVGFYFKDFGTLNIEVLLNPKMKVDTEMGKRVFEKTLSLVDTLDFSSDEKLKEQLVGLVSELGLKNGQVFWPLRVALTNEQFSPGVFEVMWALGKSRTKERLMQALKSI